MKTRLKFKTPTKGVHMSTNTESTNVKWPEIKGDIKKTWDKVADVDLEGTKGDFKAISALIQKNYGETVESYSKKLSEIFKSFEVKKEAVVEAVTAAVKK